MFGGLGFRIYWGVGSGKGLFWVFSLELGFRSEVQGFGVV